MKAITGLLLLTALLVTEVVGKMIKEVCDKPKPRKVVVIEACRRCYNCEWVEGLRGWRCLVTDSPLNGRVISNHPPPEFIPDWCPLEDA